MVKKLIILQAKTIKEIIMNKILLCFVVLISLTGCVKDQNAINPSTASSSEIDYSEQIQKEKNRIAELEKDERLIAYHNSCNAKNLEACLQAGDYIYERKFYEEAARYYDSVCANYQHLASCLRLANMFEKGIGVKKDLQKSKDIYERACYSGDKPSCKKF